MGAPIKLKYRQDFTRCDGEHCTVKEKCERYHAIQEARDNNLAYGLYVMSEDCISNNYSELTISNEPEVHP